MGTKANEIRTLFASCTRVCVYAHGTKMALLVWLLTLSKLAPFSPTRWPIRLFCFVNIYYLLPSLLALIILFYLFIYKIQSRPKRLEIGRAKTNRKKEKEPINYELRLKN
jgi:hypothetical protein